MPPNSAHLRGSSDSPPSIPTKPASTKHSPWKPPSGSLLAWYKSELSECRVGQYVDPNKARRLLTQSPLEAVSKLVVNEPFGAGSAASPLHSRQAIFRAGRLSR